jgi:hypothetical protein
VKEYKVVAVLWDDHITFQRTVLLKHPDEVIKPTLTIGFIYKNTKKTLTVVSDLERYLDHTDASYMIILKSTIRSIKEYGTIELDNITT